jgi:HEPN domain-containing protein
MTEFTKTKMHFALALLGTLFAVHQFVIQLDNVGFTYLGYRLELFHAYGLTGGLLGLSVYFYGMALLSEKPASRAERAGNYLYAIGLLIFPLYGGLYLSTLAEQWVLQSPWLAQRVDPAQLAGAGPIIALALGIFWIVVSQVLAWRLRRRLTDQDRSAKSSQLATEEMGALTQAGEMFGSNHYDLAVIQAWKALEARLRRALLARGVPVDTSNDAHALIEAAARAGVLHPANRLEVEELRKQWNVAVGVTPLTREAAEKALAAARDILATVATDAGGHKPRL